MLSQVAGTPPVLLACPAPQGGSQLFELHTVCRSDGRGVKGLQLRIFQTVGHIVVDTSSGLSTREVHE